MSIKTLVIAAIASAAAAVIVSRLWTPGTIIASAMTPVIVAIVSEIVRRPIESDAVRRPVRAVGSVTASRRTWRRAEARPPSGRTPRVMAPPPAGVDEGLARRDQGVEAGPVRVYSSGSRKRPGAGGRRRLPIRLAVATGVIAFLIAAVALTLPELIFGGSVTGGERHTTYFGGGSQSQSTDEKDSTTERQTDEPGTENKQPDAADGTVETTPGPSDSGAAPAPDGGTTAPDQTAPAAPPVTPPTTPAPQTPAQPGPSP